MVVEVVERSLNGTGCVPPSRRFYVRSSRAPVHAITLISSGLRHPSSFVFHLRWCSAYRAIHLLLELCRGLSAYRPGRRAASGCGNSELSAQLGASLLIAYLLTSFVFHSDRPHSGIILRPQREIMMHASRFRAHSSVHFHVCIRSVCAVRHFEQIRCRAPPEVFLPASL